MSHFLFNYNKNMSHFLHNHYKNTNHFANLHFANASLTFIYHQSFNDRKPSASYDFFIDEEYQGLHTMVMVQNLAIALCHK